MRYAMLRGYTDVRAHEVVRVVSERCIEVRRLKATLLNGFNSGEPDALQFSPGGFCGHTSGQQRYAFESDPDAHVFRIRLSKAGKWRTPSGMVFTLADEPREFYDYNF